MQGLWKRKKNHGAHNLREDIDWCRFMRDFFWGGQTRVSIRLEWITNKLFSIPNELTSYRLRVSLRFFKVSTSQNPFSPAESEKKRIKCTHVNQVEKMMTLFIPSFPGNRVKKEESGWKAKECIAAINYADMMWLSWHAQQGIIKARWSDKGLSLSFFFGAYTANLQSLLGISMTTMKVSG